MKRKVGSKRKESKRKIIIKKKGEEDKGIKEARRE